MSKNIREDIFQMNYDYAMISLISSKVKALVIGAGRAGFIKAKGFAAKGCSVTVVSLEFSEEFSNLPETYDLSLIKRRYSLEDIDKHHIIVIAIEGDSEVNFIKMYCESKAKLYLTCYDFREGNFIVPTQGSSKNINFAINTKEGSPTTALFIAEGAKAYLSDYDALAEYASKLRSSLKGKKALKEIMKFVSSEDFNFFLKKGFADTVINMFYPEL